MKLAWTALLCVGCQDDIATLFPDGLEPLEDNRVAAQPDGPFVETLRIETDETDFIRVYARGFALVPLTTMWTGAKTPAANPATCSTTEQQITLVDEPQYELSFIIHYIVRDILTVEWDDQFRFGMIDEQLAMVRHQKIQGSDFITLSEGTIQVLATQDPNVCELAFVEHLDAVGASLADVVQGVQHTYDAYVATAHGTPIPPCP